LTLLKYKTINEILVLNTIKVHVGHLFLAVKKNNL